MYGRLFGRFRRVGAVAGTLCFAFGMSVGSAAEAGESTESRALEQAPSRMF